jgi:integrase
LQEQLAEHPGTVLLVSHDRDFLDRVVTSTSYLEASGHGADIDGPLFRPLKHNGKTREERRGMDPDAIDRVVRKYAGALGLDRGYSAHSMRATFITTALENGAQLEDVQKAAGHRDPSTTKLYDRRGYNPEKAASFFATY